MGWDDRYASDSTAVNVLGTLDGGAAGGRVRMDEGAWEAVVVKARKLEAVADAARAVCIPGYIDDVDLFPLRDALDALDKEE